MSMRRQEKDAEKFDSECSYCGAGVKGSAMKCPSCGRWFQSGKKAVAMTLAAVVVLASMGALAYTWLGPAHEGYDGDGDGIPDGGGDGTVTGKKYMVIGTSLGTIKVELDTVNAPVTSSHMISIVNAGVYSSGTFYRAEPNFVIQGGTQSGSGGNVAWEDTGLKNSKYTISMARSGDPDSAADSGTGSSEFFINLAANTNLDNYAYPYVVFGKVVSGFSVVDQIATLPTSSSGGIMIINDPVEFTSVSITDA